MLLHDCRLAVFEITVEAGQLMELERVRDYELDAFLAVVQGVAPHRPRLSEMTTTLLARLGANPERYADIPELEATLTDWLVANKR
jgi:hypothetical protein